jgi:hypothetical protein
MSDYDTLGVPPTAGPTEIAAAYRRRIREVHPDLHPRVSEAERVAREHATVALNLAYESALGRARAHAHPPAKPAGFPTTPVGACDLCGDTPATRYRLAIRSAWMTTMLPLSDAGELELCAECAAQLHVASVQGGDECAPADDAGARRPRRRRRGPAALIAVAIVALLVFLVLGPSATHPLLDGCVAPGGPPRLVACRAVAGTRVDSIEHVARSCPHGDGSWPIEPHVVLCLKPSQERPGRPASLRPHDGSRGGR